MLTQGQIIEFIEKVFGAYKLSNGGLNVSVSCPICNETEDQGTKKKLVIRSDNWLCHCWKCGFKAHNLHFLIKKYRHDFIAEYEDMSGIKPLLTVSEYEQQKTEIAAVKLPQDFTLLALHWNDRSASSYLKEAIFYLKRRGLELKDFWYWKFGVSEEPALLNRVIIPSFDKDGLLNYYTARAFNKYAKPKYYNPKAEREKLIFNELNINWKQELTLVEGIFDATKANENVTCLLGSEFGPNYLLFQKIIEHNTPILLALDNDAKEKSLKYAKLLASYGISVRILDIPEEKNDVGELTKVFFQSIQKNAKPFEMSSFIKMKLKEAEKYV